MTAIVTLNKPEAKRRKHRLPWPLISAKSCRHLDWYPQVVKGDLDDGSDDYECEVCALCGAVRGLKLAQGGERQAPVLKGLVTWMSKAADGYVDWKGDPRYRWITMHPHGKDEPGYPVLLRMDDAEGGGSTGTVVGGAGGSMNYRRVTGIRTKGEYRTEARAGKLLAAQRKEKKKEKQIEEAREAGLSEEAIEQGERERRESIKDLRNEQARAEAEHLSELQDILGWEAVRLPEALTENMEPDTVRRLERERRRNLLKAAEAAERKVQDAVIAEHDRAVAEALSDVRVEDLITDEVDDSGLGYVAAVSRLAEENGLGERGAKKASRRSTNETLLAAQEQGFIEDAGRARNYIDSLQAMAAMARIKDAPFKAEGHHKPETPMEMDPEEQKRLLLAREKFKQRQREIRARQREIEKAAPQDVTTMARGSALSEISTISDDEALSAVEDSLQARARITAADKLLTRIEELEGGVKSTEQHLFEGRHVQLQEVAQAVFSQPLTMRREVLDLLGPEAGGRLMGRLMRQGLSEEEFATVAEALRQEHIETQVERAREAMTEAQEHFEAAQAAFAGFGTVGELGPEGLEAASAAKAERMEQLREARRVLGVTLGRLQMLGTLNAALAEGEAEGLDVALGQISGAQAWQVGAALGLSREKGEYEVQSDGPNKYLRVAQKALHKLVEAPDPELAAQYEVATAIKRGDHDEDGWLADGLMKRPSEKYYDDPDFTAGWGVDAHELLDGKYGAGLEAGVREYAGRMLANGGAAGIGSLRMRMLSAEWQRDNLDDRQRAEFAGVVASVFPANAAEDNWTAIGEELVAPYIAESTAERAALDAQNIDVVSARDPIHRALQAVPQGKIAFTPISRLTPQDKELIRDYFWERLTDEKRPSAVESRASKQEKEESAEEVVAQQYDIFGNLVEVKRGDTESFAAKQAQEGPDQGDNAWARYVKAMKGTGNAYATVQSLIQGDLAEQFATHYGREAGRGLRTAPADVPNALRHVIGLMPKDALERVLDADGGALREMYAGLRKRDTKGRYSQGEVANLAVRILEKAKKMQLQLFGDVAPGAQRLSIGTTAEKQLRQAWAQVAPAFDPERPAHIIENLAQSGPKYVHQQRAIKMLEQVGRMGLHHSTGCIAGDTLLVDPLTGKAKTVREHHDQRTSPRVLAVRPDGSFAVVEADVPFVKGTTRLLTVRTEAGREVTVAPDHLFLTEQGWRRACDLAPRNWLCAAGAATGSDTTRPASERSIRKSVDGRISPSGEDRRARSAREALPGLHLREASVSPREYDACHPQTTAAPGRSVPRPSAARLRSTDSGYRGRCSDGRRRYDARPHGASAGALSAPTSRGGAPAGSRCAARWDGPGNARGHSRPCPIGALHPTPGCDLRAGRGHGIQSRTSPVGAAGQSLCNRVPVRSATGSSAHRGTYGAVWPRRVRTPAACLSLVGYLARVALATRAFGPIREQQRSSLPTCTLPKEPQLLSVLHPCAAPPTVIHPQPILCSIPEWDRVSIVAEAEVEDYFDFEVPVYHNYVAHGLVHHNSGKSLASLGAFTHLHAQGKVKRGLYMVPPKVQAQFGGEINAYAEPGRYTHFSDPSATAQERRAAYADPDRNMVVVSHQAWRDDVTWAVAQDRFDGDQQAAAEWLRTGERAETGPAVKAALAAQGWDFGFQCLPPDALVAMADGTQRRICEVHPGEAVVTVNEATGRVETKRVAARLRNPGTVKRMLRIVAGGHVLECTADHRIMTADRGWVRAHDLTVGEHVFANGASTCYTQTAGHAGIEGVGRDVRRASRDNARRRLHGETECGRQSAAADQALGEGCSLYGAFDGAAEVDLRSSGHYEGEERRVGRRHVVPLHAVSAGVGGTLHGELPERAQGGSGADRGLANPRGHGLLVDGRRFVARIDAEPINQPLREGGLPATSRSAEGLRHHNAPPAREGKGPLVNSHGTAGGRDLLCVGEAVCDTVDALQACDATEGRALCDLPHDDEAGRGAWSLALLKRLPTAEEGGVRTPTLQGESREVHSECRQAARGTHGRSVTSCGAQPTAARIESIEEVARVKWVYDLTVAGNHNFFAQGLLVHNCVDEGHDTLNRRGKPDSRLARVIDATTEDAQYFVTMTATPVKNDPSEVYDLLRKVRPDKFPADGYEDFRRRYALNTEANREALQRLVAPYFYAKNVDTGVAERKYDVGVGLSDWQQERYRGVLEAYNAARKAPEGSEERREAIRALVPDEAFRGLEPEQAARKLDDLGGALGFTRDRAISRVLEHAPAEHNPRIQKVVEIAKRHAGADDDGGQVPGLVFAQSLQSVRLLADELKKQGFRVGVITGELGGAETELRRADFNSDAAKGKGDDLAQEAANRRALAKYDILVGSGAAGTGLNMERARWLAHYDQPWTAKEITQRNGRQNRLSQKWGEVEIHTLGTDVPHDRRRRDLVQRKAGLMSTFMEPTEYLDDTGLARRIREARAERLSNATETALGITPRRPTAGGGGEMAEAAT